MNPGSDHDWDADLGEVGVVVTPLEPPFTQDVYHFVMTSGTLR